MSASPAQPADDFADGTPDDPADGTPDDPADGTPDDPTDETAEGAEKCCVCGESDPQEFENDLRGGRISQANAIAFLSGAIDQDAKSLTIWLLRRFRFTPEQGQMLVDKYDYKALDPAVVAEIMKHVPLDHSHHHILVKDHLFRWLFQREKDMKRFGCVGRVNKKDYPLLAVVRRGLHSDKESFSTLHFPPCSPSKTEEGLRHFAWALSKYTSEYGWEEIRVDVEQWPAIFKKLTEIVEVHARTAAK